MKILIPFDGSHSSQLALKQGSEIAKSMDAQVLLQTVVMSRPTPHSLVINELMSNINPEMLTEKQLMEKVQTRVKSWGRETLNPAVQHCKRLELDYEVRISQGLPREEICKLAEDEDVNLIVMGSRGLGMLRSLLMGSVCRYVMVHAPCSVLVARDPSVASDSYRGGLSHPDDQPTAMS